MKTQPSRAEQVARVTPFVIDVMCRMSPPVTSVTVRSLLDSLRPTTWTLFAVRAGLPPLDVEVIRTIVVDVEARLELAEEQGRPVSGRVLH
jgi:hypothetical protein